MRSQLLAPIHRGIEWENLSVVAVPIMLWISAYSRHSEVSKLLTKFLRKASSNARVTLDPGDTSARHPDIAVVEDSGHYHIDVAIVEPTSRRATSSAESSATTKGAAAAYMERTKITSYANTAWPATVPFALESPQA